MPKLKPKIQEIDFNEIELLHVIGKGSFGTVRKARWRGQDVAVKLIETKGEKDALDIEIQQLSRADHPNIIKLFGACSKSTICLVMEYADCGSLHQVLHSMPYVSYTAGHAISWALQCARGIAYLHNMDTKPVIHRDLKPLNLLLVDGGTKVKICDFGTACDIRTIMTTVRGSAAWMAPEVFEGTSYTEKCDIFSWAIILWEMLTRRIPFHGMELTSLQIMWKVFAGYRPPLIKGCPKPLEKLMTSCWAQNPKDRPSMSEVERDLSVIARFFPGGDQPLKFPDPSDTLGSTSLTTEEGLNSNTSFTNQSAYRSIPTNSKSLSFSQHIGHRRSHSSGASFLSSCKAQTEPSPLLPEPTLPKEPSPSPPKEQPTPTPSPQPPPSPPRPAQHPHPNSSTPVDQPHLELPTSSHLSPLPPSQPSPSLPMASAYPSLSKLPSPPVLSPRPGPSISPRPGPSSSTQEPSSSFSSSIISEWYMALDPQLQPLPPLPDCPESQALFESHRQLAVDYLRQHAELDVLTQRKLKLIKELDNPKRKSLTEEYNRLLVERASLQKLLASLRQRIAEATHLQNNADDDWEVII